MENTTSAETLEVRELRKYSYRLYKMLTQELLTNDEFRAWNWEYEKVTRALEVPNKIIQFRNQKEVSV